jgi:hypothetical protein
MSVQTYDYRREQLERAKQRALLESVSVAKLVKVVAADELGYVDVQPLAKTMIDGVYVTPPLLLNVPVLARRDSNGHLDFPKYSVGDVGLIIICDGDIDTQLAAKNIVQPETDRLHSQDDSIFVGCL